MASERARIVPMGFVATTGETDPVTEVGGESPLYLRVFTRVTALQTATVASHRCQTET